MSTAGEFERVLRLRQLQSLFQPIRQLPGEALAGHEALIRGPTGTSLAEAPALVHAAYRTGRVVEFDWTARALACQAALDAGVPADHVLFLNVEPLALASSCPPSLVPIIEEAYAKYRIVLEVTERSLERDPRSLLDGVDRQRPAVAGLAIDDVGASSAALSMLPVLAPDVIKLDMSLIHAGPTADTLKVLDIAYEEAERTGANVLAEGIETTQHAAFAQAIGAHLGQGLLYGAPGPIHASLDQQASDWGIFSKPVAEVARPFDAMAGGPTSRAGTDLLMPMSRQIAYGNGVQLTHPALLLIVVPAPQFLTAIDDGYLREVAQRGVAVAVLGPPPTLRHDVRANVAPNDWVGEWAVVSLAPALASAMLARRRPDNPDEFDFGVTHDRVRVLAAARTVLRRVGPN